MLLWITTLQPERGKSQEAVAVAKEAVTIANQGFGPTRPAEVFTELFGAAGQIYITIGLQDWDEYQRYLAWQRGEQKWPGLLARLLEATLPGSRKDTLLQTT